MGVYSSVCGAMRLCIKIHHIVHIAATLAISFQITQNILRNARLLWWVKFMQHAVDYSCHQNCCIMFYPLCYTAVLLNFTYYTQNYIRIPN